MNTPSNQPPQVGGYQVERLDDVSRRLSYMEGKMDSLATKEDVANAKLQMMITWVGVGITILITVGTIAIRFWSTSGGG